ncbi:MAG: GNAT family N-acetyltransferase [Lachnospiraceae bacterium]|nr:GNAT family N-acetyltransferase [Lachnospiraceae bacterium]
MKKKAFDLRPLAATDYQELYALWKSIKGFSIRYVDDSKEGIERFLDRNPSLSVAAVAQDQLIGAILCGHDGRQGCLYHVCVQEQYRCCGVGKAMVTYCVEALRKVGITKVKLIAFTKNDLGNGFWTKLLWTKRSDINYYDFTLDERNTSETV